MKRFEHLRQRSLVLVFGVMALGLCVPSLAAEPDDAWHLYSMGGFWPVSIDGTIGVRNLKSDIDADISDVFDNSNFTLNPGLKLTKGNWVFGFTGQVMQLQDDGRTFRNGARGDITVTEAMADLTIGYTIVRTELGDMPFQLTPYAGAQITYFKIEINPDLAETQDKDRTWVDPIVGGEAVLNFSKDFAWRTDAFIGGFGVSSELVYGAGTYLDWQFSKRWELNVGYRIMSWDYDNDDFIWDSKFYGPWIGITSKWF